MLRFYALDRMRALAVVAMVQGHTFSALLAEGALPGWFMQLHAVVHGVTAPAFLLGAGLAFALASYPSYERHHAGGRLLAQRSRRYAWLVLLGYALQLPGSSLLAALRMRSEDLIPVLRIGPLHLIALCLMIAQLGALVFDSPRKHALAMLALGALVTVSAPFVYAARAGQGAGPFWGAWLDASYGSLFPIFPWASFAFFGVALGGLLSLRGAVLPRPAIWLTPGLSLAAGCYLLFRLGVRWSEPAWFWHASPLNVLFRVGLVLSLLGLLHGLPTPSERARSLTSLLARHSLVAFVVHLLLLYGTPYTPSLNKHFAHALDGFQASALSLAIMVLTVLAIRLWARVHEGRRLDPSWVRALLTAVGVLVLMR